jgi:hypothetical protein
MSSCSFIVIIRLFIYVLFIVYQVIIRLLICLSIIYIFDYLFIPIYLFITTTRRQKKMRLLFNLLAPEFGI